VVFLLEVKIDTAGTMHFVALHDQYTGSAPAFVVTLIGRFGGCKHGDN
jgi:hypothetical protein